MDLTTPPFKIGILLLIIIAFTQKNLAIDLVEFLYSRYHRCNTTYFPVSETLKISELEHVLSRTDMILGELSAMASTYILGLVR